MGVINCGWVGGSQGKLVPASSLGQGGLKGLIDICGIQAIE